jgi:putative pyoverdin transport system ATP-binding/permease protein
MDLLRFLLQSSRRHMLGLVAVSLASGAASAVLLAIIHRTLAPAGLGIGLLAAGFGVALLAKVATQYLSQVLLVEFAQQVVLRLCRGLCDRVLAAPLDRLEALGSARLLATLNDDVAVLSGAVLMVPAITANLAVLLGCSFYLAWLSWPVFLLCGAMVALGVLGYRLLLRRAQLALVAARNGRDRLFGNFRTLIEGVKELKLHAPRRADFVRTEIDATTELLRSQNVAAIHRHLVADVWSQLLFFALIAMLLFGAPALAPMSQGTLTGYVFAALYMMAPMWALVDSVPSFMRGRVSLAKIRELDGSLLTTPPAGPPATNPTPAADTPAADTPAADTPAATTPAPILIELEAACYAYPAPSRDEAGFVLGPLDLRLAGGEVVFVTGGNGCGKSTLVRMLTGLYAPTSGAVRCNGKLVDDAGREGYRQWFSAVFADFHLFERLFGLDARGRGDEIRRYLGVLGMDHKVSVRDDRLSTTALSSGQRRRLALLTAYLEDRAVYVFDEWAADQDPAYKQVFYVRLLPELKARGKCVVVVTHDDRYFALGDRVIKLDSGQIVHEDRHALSARS